MYFFSWNNRVDFTKRIISNCIRKYKHVLIKSLIFSTFIHLCNYRSNFLNSLTILFLWGRNSLCEIMGESCVRSKNFKFWAGKFKGSLAVYKQMARANTYPSLNIIKNSESDCHARIFYITGLGHHIYQKSGADCENLAVFTTAQRQIFPPWNWIEFHDIFASTTYIIYCMEGKNL